MRAHARPRRHLLRTAAAATGALALAAALCGCPSGGAAPAARTPAAAATTPLEHPVGIEADGPLVHAATNLGFPQRAAGFVRRESKRYDAEGHDLGIGYTRVWPTAVAEVTVYVYPRPTAATDGSQQPPGDHVEAVVGHVYEAYDDVAEIHRAGGVATLRGSPVEFATIELGHRGGPTFFGRRVTSVSSVVAAESWWIKVRVTTPADHRAAALAAVEELLAELGLPATGLPAGDG